MNCRRTAQMAFVLGGFLGKNVALEGLTALDGTARTHHEALCSTLLGLHLRHDNSIIRWIWVCARPDGHYPPFETQSTWYAAGRYCWPLLFRNCAHLSGRCSETCWSSPHMRRSTTQSFHSNSCAPHGAQPGNALATTRVAYFFFFGASTMIIWRPSIFGICST